jgi:N-acetyl-alpha-D-glucosaminyl L-malate synthase BshA
MKIGITCYPTYGGSGALATELGLELARRGHEVHFITYASPFRLRGYAERVFFHEVETTMGRYPLFDHYPYTLALASKQHEVALREDLDLLHVHYAIPHATTAWLAREMLKGEGRKLKVITTLHGTDITLVGQEASFYAITKFSIEQSDLVTAVSAYLRDETYRAFGCVSCDVKVIPNFVNLAEYFPDPARRWEGLAPAGHRHIMHVSNFREVKRVKDVVRVFARIRRAMPATLVMVGDGPERPEAESEAKELGVAEDVKFLGRLDSVAMLLQGCELFLLPSTTESFGLAALEAMACGAVVVATRVGGIPEVVNDGIDGILEPVGSVEAMGRRAVDLLRDGDALARMRDAAIAKAGQFSADRIVPMYEALYAEVVR